MTIQPRGRESAGVTSTGRDAPGQHVVGVGGMQGIAQAVFHRLAKPQADAGKDRGEIKGDKRDKGEQPETRKPARGGLLVDSQ